MIKRGVLFLLLVLCCPSFGVASPIVADLSQYRIEMDAGFNGTRIFLFGVRNDVGDVIIVIRGPQKDFILRKKEPVMGIWVNSDRMKFFDLPDFYIVATSKPLTDIEQDSLFRQLGIGHEVLFSPPANPMMLGKFQEYSEAFLHYQQKRKLYAKQPLSLQFMGETLFKTVIEFPDTIPPGDYTAEIYLISDGEVTGMQSLPVTVSKSGVDAFLYRYAHQFPTLYGITAIVMALAAGWFAGRLFEKL